MTGSGAAKVSSGVDKGAGLRTVRKYKKEPCSSDEEEEIIDKESDEARVKPTASCDNAPVSSLSPSLSRVKKNSGSAKEVGRKIFKSQGPEIILRKKSEEHFEPLHNSFSLQSKSQLYVLELSLPAMMKSR